MLVSVLLLKTIGIVGDFMRFGRGFPRFYLADEPPSTGIVLRMVRKLKDHILSSFGFRV